MFVIELVIVLEFVLVLAFASLLVLVIMLEFVLAKFLCFCFCLADLQEQTILWSIQSQQKQN